LKTLFNWAMRQELVDDNPCRRLQPPTQIASRDRVLANDELAKVLSAASSAGYPFGTVVELLALTSQRRGEIAALQWSWIDDKERTIAIPAVIAKNRRQHVFPYGQLVADLFARIPQTGDLLFPARGRPEAPYSGWSKNKATVDRLSGVTNWTLHDLRRTFATNLAALGTPIHVTEKILNHVSGTMSGVAAIYNRHAYMDEMRIANLAWEKRLLEIIGSGASIPSCVASDQTEPAFK
jgi:integrase